MSLLLWVVPGFGIKAFDHYRLTATGKSRNIVLSGRRRPAPL